MNSYGLEGKEEVVIVVVGRGKLATELLSVLPTKCSTEVVAWASGGPAGASAIVVHAGSGRELDDVMAYCQKTGSTLVELATGSDILHREVAFPVVVCPNINVLMLKFLAMVAGSGHLFKAYEISVTESHQASKASVPGTAVTLAESLGVPSSEIVSIRDPREQQESLRIPAEHLTRHAYHRIEIKDQGGSVVLETRIFGPAPYAEGLAKILAAIQSHRLENRHYSVLELIENGWV